jgi:hypothetical protein
MKLEIIKLYVFFLLLVLNTEGSAQVAINADGSPPNPNAILDLSSTNKAFLPPRMTNAQIKAIPSPTEGMLAYDTEFKCLRMYTGSEWICQQSSNKELSDPPGDFSIFTTTSLCTFTGTTTDPIGNVYVTGSFAYGVVTFGSYTLTNTGIGREDVFLVKYNSSGVVQWAVNGGGASDDYGWGIAVDGSGNVYVTGYFRSSTAIFGSTTLTNTSSGNYSDIFIVKYNSSGVVQWAVKGGGASDDDGKGIAVDGNGNVYVTGSFSSSSATFGSTTLTNTSSGNYSDVFVVKYNSNGVVQWAVKGGSISYDDGYGITIDYSGNVYVTGDFGGGLNTATFGSITLTPNGGIDVFVVKYNSSGVVQWAAKGGGTGYDHGSGIAVDGVGNVYIIGSFPSAAAIFGSTTLTNTNPNSNSYTDNDVFVVKYNSSGVVQWAVKGGGTGYDHGSGIAVDGSANVYITGIFRSSTATFGSTTLTNTNTNTNSDSYNDNDVFVVKYNSNGVVQWAVKGGGASSDGGLDIVVNTLGTRVYTIVSHTPNAKFGNTIVKTDSYLIWMYGE